MINARLACTKDLDFKSSASQGPNLIQSYKRYATATASIFSKVQLKLLGNKTSAILVTR